MPADLLRYADAGNAACAAEMREDESVFLMGTNPPPELSREFDRARVRRMPISEAMFTGIAVGAAAEGMRPVVMWRNVTFSFVAFDQVANQAAKLRYMSGGQRSFPIVFRCHGGGGDRMAAQHSQSPYSIYAHLPGLKVIVPSNAADAYGLMRAAIRDEDPVVCFEATALDTTAAILPGGDHVLEIGKAHVCRAGSDVTVVAVGLAVQKAEAAAEELSRDGISVELIDLRTVAPLDGATVKESVRRTGRLVVVDEAPALCSVASEVLAVVTEDEESFRALRAPAIRVSGAHVPVPYAPALEDEVLPRADRIALAIRRVMGDG